LIEGQLETTERMDAENPVVAILAAVEK
jgi:hypothetical protein